MNNAEQLKKYLYTRRDHILVTIIVLVSLLFVITILYRCHFGIDMTDEGYYLNWISNPWLYKLSNSQFGYVYYPLYRLVGENIVLLRQTNMLIMLGLSWILCVKLLRYTLHNESTVTDSPPAYLYGLAFALATGVFVFFGGWWWIPTPSYNSLVLEALLIATIALINVSMRNARVTDWIILGVGGWLAFMAKPTTAIALGILSFLYILILATQVKSFKIFRLIISVLIACGLTCLSAWLIDGSIYAFIMRLQNGVELQMLSFNGHVFSFLPKYGILPNDPGRLLLPLFTLLAFLATAVSTHTPTKAHAYYCFALLFISVLICINYYVIPIKPNPWTANLFLAIPLGSWLALKIMPGKTALKFTSLLIFFTLLPYASAIGTYEDIWIVMLRSSFFWMLALLPFLTRIKQPLLVRWRVIMSIVVGTQLLTFSLVQLGMEHPYRQTQSLRAQTKSLEIMSIKGRVIGTLIVSDDDAHYIDQLRNTVLNHGFSYGDSMIDLTGNHPAALYAIGAKALGFPWLPTGFVGSTDIVVSTLSQSSCHELVSAWVLTAFNTIQEFNPKILESHGIGQKNLSVIGGMLDAKYNIKNQVMRSTRPYHKAVLICERKHFVQKEAKRSMKIKLKNIIPSSVNIIQLSLTYIKDHQLDEAVSLLKNAILINPIIPEFYNNLCYAYGLQNKYNEATMACSHALQLAPDFELAKHNLAWVVHEKELQKL